MSNDKASIANPTPKLDDIDDATVKSASTTSTSEAIDVEKVAVKGASDQISPGRRRRRFALFTVATLLVIGILVVGVGYAFCPARRKKQTAAASSASTTSSSSSSNLALSGGASSATGGTEGTTQESMEEKVTEGTTQESMEEKVVDFSSFTKGEYVKDQLLEDYHVMVTAAAKPPVLSHATGFTPEGAARIFDTANPVDASGNGNIHLGSPHSSCGGPGEGWGGKAGKKYQNCRPLGNVLVIQHSDTASPDAYCRGGTLTFDFEFPVDMREVALFNIRYNHVVEVQVSDVNGKVVKKQTPRCVGENGVYYMDMAVGNATQVQVLLPGSEAVAHLKYRA